MNTLLFFDDQHLQTRDNADICQGRPVIIPESIYRDPQGQLVNLAWGYPYVTYEELHGIWLMFYQGWPVDHQALPCPLALMACSKDGLLWQPFVPAQEEASGQYLLTNQYLPLIVDGARFAEAQVYKDPFAAGDERYKALTLYRKSSFRFDAHVFVSSDGLRWRKKDGVRWHAGEDAPDYPLGIFYNEHRKSYVITGRPAHCDRRIALRETKDWVSFSAPELLMQPDCMDRTVSDLYGMPAVAYRNQFIGFLEIFEPVPYAEFKGVKPSGLPTHKFLDGHVSCQLTYSQTGWIFQRFMRQPFISQDDPEGPEFGGVYPTCLVEREKDLLIYASVTALEHGRIPEGGGAIAAYALRKDGFSFLRARNGFARVRTKGLLLRGGQIEWNVRAVNGDFLVQFSSVDGETIPGFAFSDCIPFSGDSLCHVPEFSSGRVMKELQGQVIVIDMEFRHSDLFSISGDFSILSPYGIGYMKETGQQV